MIFGLRESAISSFSRHSMFRSTSGETCMAFATLRIASASAPDVATREYARPSACFTS